VRTLSNLIVEELGKAGESLQGGSKRIFADPRMLHRFVSDATKVSGKALVRLVKGYKLHRRPQDLQRWMLAYLWGSLDQDGQRLLESSGLLDLVSWEAEAASAAQDLESMLMPTSRELSATLGTAVVRTAVLHTVCVHSAGSCDVYDVRKATRISVQHIRSSLAYLSKEGYLTRSTEVRRITQDIQNSGLFPFGHDGKMGRWGATEKGLTYDRQHGERMLKLLPEFLI